MRLDKFQDLRLDLMNVSMNQARRDWFLKTAVIWDILKHDKGWTISDKNSPKGDILEVLEQIDNKVGEYLEHIMRIYITRQQGQEPISYTEWTKRLVRR